MGEKCKVSVLCTAYNHEKYIRDALEGSMRGKSENTPETFCSSCLPLHCSHM